MPPGRELALMEVCGGHTHAIYKHGIDELLPPGLELVHGPGCPVCVIPVGRVDDAVSLALEPNVVFTTFGDMMRVPGSKGSLLDARSRGADVRMVYSPLDALELARTNPEREVVFFAIGFETTTPSTAITLLQARAQGVRNFSVFCNHVTIAPPLKAILDAPELRLDGLIAPGHVSAVIGSRPYEFIASDYGRPVVVAGFEPLDILQSVLMLVRQLAKPCRGREPVQPRGARGRKSARAGGDRADDGAARQLRVARPGLDPEKRAAPAARSSRIGTPNGATRCPESTSPTTRPASADRCCAAWSSPGVQGLRHRLHARAPDRHLHGLVRGRLRRVLPLRAEQTEARDSRLGREADARGQLNALPGSGRRPS